MRPYSYFLKILIRIYLIITLVVIGLTAINLTIYLQTKKFIFQNSTLTSHNEKKDYAIVLGASVHGEKLSQALRYRVNAAINLYQKGLVKKILMSGDGMSKNYNETIAMKKFAIRQGIPEIDIVTDAQGFNTSASIVRSKKIFHIKNAYVISQEFHIGRAVWIARRIGMNVEGVSVGGFKVFDYYTFREIFARAKDFFKIMIYRT